MLQVVPKGFAEYYGISQWVLDCAVRVVCWVAPRSLQGHARQCSQGPAAMQSA